MSREQFKLYKSIIREIRDDIFSEIKKIDTFNATKATQIMCRVWSTRGIIDNVYKHIHEAYFDAHCIDMREFNALEKYLDRLSDYIWSEFYDKAAERDRDAQALYFKNRIMEGGEN